MSETIKEPSSLHSIRFQDCDPLGHLNNSRYLDYFLNAREEHLEKFYNLKLADFIQRGFGWVVANHEIYYLKPALLNETVKIQTSMIDLTEDQLTIEGIMMNESGSLTKALLWTRYVFVSIHTGKKDKHPPDIMEFLSGIKNEKVIREEGSKARVQQLLTKEKMNAV